MEEQSYFFDFQRSPTFFEKWNIDFNVVENNTSNNFNLLFCAYAPDNIEDCLNSNGSLSTNVTIAPQGTIPCSLKWDDGIVSLRNDVTWNIGDNVYPLKAVFIANSNYVMGFSINVQSFEVTKKVILEAGTILWSIQDGK